MATQQDRPEPVLGVDDANVSPPWTAILFLVIALVALLLACVTLGAAVFGGPKAAGVWVPIVSAVTACAGVITACVVQISKTGPRFGFSSLRRWPRPRLILWSAACAAVIGAAALSVPLLFRDIIKVPDVRGLSRPTAESTFEKAGIDVVRIADEIAHRPIGHVIKQQPAAGEHLEGDVEGSLVVSRGVEVPSLLGSSLTAAKAKLRDEDLRWGRFTRRFSPAPSEGVMPPTQGTVLDQKPKPETFVDPGSSIHVVESRGVHVPSVIGRPRRAARQALKASSFEVVERSTFNRRYKGLIVKQTPAGDTGLDAGGRVAIVRSLGPEPRAHFVEPKPHRRVPLLISVTVKLRREQLATNGHFWLAIDAPHGLIPKEPRVDRARSSTQAIYESGEGLLGATFDLVLLRVNAAGDRRIRSWLSRGKLTDDFPAFEGPGTGPHRLPGLQTLARVPGLWI